MPTSSQARILRRENIDLHSLLRIPHYHRTSVGSNAAAASAETAAEASETACFFPTSQALSLPHIFKSSSASMAWAGAGFRPFSSTTIGTSGTNFSRRLPALVCYPSEFQNGSFTRRSVHVFPNVSNNWPDEDMDPDSTQPHPPDSGRRSKEPKAESSGENKDAKNDRRMSIIEKKQKSSAHHGTNSASRRKSSAASHARLKKQLSNKRGSNDSSGSGVFDPHMSLEVNLLALDDESEGESETEAQEIPVIEVGSEITKEQEVKPKLTIRSLYKQLLSIGMSSNAFRGVMVKTEGGMKNATEKEAEEALDAMASGIVDEEDEEGPEESQEDGDVELVMGTLLADVGDKGMVHVSDTDDAARRKESASSRRRSDDKEAAFQAFSKSVDLDTPPTNAKIGSAFMAGLDFTGGVGIDEKDESAEKAPGSKKTTDADKAFLQSVAAGVALGGGAKKQAPKAVERAERAELKKKKVYKLPPVRLRRGVPPENPHLLCIRTPSVDLTHEQVKNMLEAQLGTIVSLQHDPEYLQNGDVQLPPRAMWIFKMEDIQESNYARICMDSCIGYDGETLRIRKRDDVYKEENRAYMLVKQIKDEQAKRMKARVKDRRVK